MAYENILNQIANPKASNYLDSYLGGVQARSALDEQQREGQARQLAGQALTGDKAAGQQLAQVDPQVFMKLKEFQGDQRAKELERVGGLYYRADTPEKWAMAQDFLKKASYDVSPEDLDFSNRDALLGMTMSAAQQITMEHQNRSFGLQEREFAANQSHRAQSLALEREKMAQSAGKDSLAAKMMERAQAAQAMGLEPGSPEHTQFTLTGKTGDLVKGAADQEKARLRQETMAPYAESASKAIDDAIAIVEGFPGRTTGLGGQVFSNIGGTRANDLRTALDTVKANVGFDKLQAMRDASPTGGALGQVSTYEINLLQSVIASLDQSQTPEKLLENLERVRQVTDQIVNHGIKPGGENKSDRSGTGQTSTGLKWSVE